jgi:hypothetical protein
VSESESRPMSPYEELGVVVLKRNAEICDLKKRVSELIETVASYWDEILWVRGRVRHLMENNAKLENLAQALLSVLSEDGVKEYLSAYVMGVELIERARELEAE